MQSPQRASIDLSSLSPHRPKRSQKRYSLTDQDSVVYQKKMMPSPKMKKKSSALLVHPEISKNKGAKKVVSKNARNNLLEAQKFSSSVDIVQFLPITEDSTGGLQDFILFEIIQNDRMCNELVPKASDLFYFLQWLVLEDKKIYWHSFLLTYRMIGISDNDVIKNLEEICERFPASNASKFLDDFHDNQNLSKNSQKQNLDGIPCSPTTNRLVRLSSTRNLSHLKKSTFEFSSFSVQKVSSQLQKIELDLLKKIDIHTEFVGSTWTKPCTSSCPNIMTLIERFNLVSKWIGTEIVTANPKKQGKMIKRFIKIAQECRFRNNFNTLMEILAALNLCSVARLKSWNGLKDKHKETLKNLETLMSSENNYSRYRLALKYAVISSRTKYPVIPYFALILKDISSLDEVEPNHLHQLYNMRKLRKLGTILSEVKYYQRQIFYEEEDPIVLNYLMNLTVMEYETLYECSKE